MTLALTNEWGKEEDATAFVIAENHVDDLFLGIFCHLLASMIAVSCTCACIEQTQVIVNLGGCAHGGTGILVGSLLFDTDDRTETCNLIYIRTFHAAQKIAGVCRESFDIASLAFGKDGVEG